MKRPKCTPIDGSFRNRLASLLAAVAVLPGACALAQVAPAPQLAKPALTTEVPGADRLTPSELEELLGPIALYPDPLLANVLAAAVYPAEVMEASKFVAGGGKPEQVDIKAWEAPVKAVAKIPDAIKMMGQYEEWTIALGQAYLTQAKDVMDVVQSLRKKAQASGALQTSPQQKVVVEQQVVYIKPADPEVIYVPTYSPSVVYVEDKSNDAAVAGVVGFGLGVATGLILANNLDCDYHGGCVSYGWHGGGSYHGGGNYHGGNYNSGNYRGGNNTVNINGDVNIGNTNKNVSGNNVGNTANVGNRVGNEGNAWAPNRSKSVATAERNQLNQFKGGNTAANRAAVPGRGTAANTANTANRGSGTAGQSAARPAGQPTAARPAGQPAARPTDQSAARSAAKPAARPSNPPAASPKAGEGRLKSSTDARSAAPSASTRTPQRQPSASAFSGGRDTQVDSQRGAASRSQSQSPGGASRSAAPSRSSRGSARR